MDNSSDAPDFTVSQRNQQENNTETEDKMPSEQSQEDDIIYKVEDIPPWYLSVILGLQHYLTMLSGALASPYIISSKLCMSENDPGRGHIISTTFFVAGFASFLQATFGTRLPIIQGPSLSFLLPVLAILELPRWECPKEIEQQNLTRIDTDEIWMLRMRELQGAVIVASLFEVAIGFTGLIGLLMKWITPLTIAPTITLIGLALFGKAAESSSDHWGMAVLTMTLLIGFSQYLANINAPNLSYDKEKGCHVSWFPLFKLFPNSCITYSDHPRVQRIAMLGRQAKEPALESQVMLTILFSWGICALLTITNVFPEGNKARTDLRTESIADAPWIRVPYPGQWGMPTISLGAVLGVLAGVTASTIESVGDYYACARIAGAPPPPTHAINRGIWMEGLGCVAAGICGTGSGLTSISPNIGAIGITKVGSRRVIQFASVIITISGMMGKFGTLFIIIPPPIMGGIICIMFSIITGVGISSIQYVNLNSSRNLFVLGFSIFMGLCIPEWMSKNKDAINTGNEAFDQVITVLLSTSMFIGGFLGCFLDNTLPGSKRDRGIEKWREQETLSGGSRSSVSECYDLPFVMGFLRRVKCFSYLPISPTFNRKKGD